MIFYISMTIVILGSLFMISSALYLFFGLFKFLYHDILGWHEPADDENIEFDGCNKHCICKYCRKEIMQDSQGNWF